MQNQPFSVRLEWIILAGVGLLVLAATALLLFDREQPVQISIQPPLPTATHTASPSPSPSVTAAPLQIYVTGAVANPQSRLALQVGARVEDAISAAGGTTADADLSRVNLAALLRDGDHIHVPGQQESASAPASPSPNAPRQLDLNSASQQDLEALPRIGPATALDILAYREEMGGFRAVEELLNVPGIGEATLENLREFVTVDPAFIPAALAAESTAPVQLNLNHASQEELQSLPGVGEAIAARIVEYRSSNGDFTAVDDLLEVAGIGPAMLERLRPLVTVEG